MTMITPSYLGETIEYSSLHACRSTLEDPTDTPVYMAIGLRPGQHISGPAIIAEPATTLVVYPGMSTRVSGSGHYILHVAPSEGEPRR